MAVGWARAQPRALVPVVERDIQTSRARKMLVCGRCCGLEARLAPEGLRHAARHSRSRRCAFCFRSKKKTFPEGKSKRETA
eukprot:scaffold1054_cov116-Isochrysis_galbana.AAC.22